MNDLTLRQLLRELPAAAASVGFTARVGSRLAQTRRRHTAPPRLRLAAAAALLVTVAVAGVLWREHAVRRQRVAELQAARQDLARDLAGVRQLAARPAGVVVEAAPDRRVLIDLELLGGAGASAPEPVSFTY